MTGRGAKECTFRAILKVVRAYFETVFRIEQIRKCVANALKIPVNLIIITNSITNANIKKIFKSNKN